MSIYDKLRLSLFPILIFFATSIFLIISINLFNSMAFKMPILLISLYFYSISIRLAFTLKSKLRSIVILIKKNKRKLIIESFSEYMKAPCGRQVVKIVLHKIDKYSLYTVLKQEYPIRLFVFGKSKTKIIFYKNGEVIKF